MEITAVSGKTGYFLIENCLILTYALSERELVLIDTGYVAYSPLLSWLEAQGLRVAAVLHTHLHEDHIGNDLPLQQKFGMPIYAASEEIDLGRDEPKHWSVLGLAGKIAAEYRSCLWQLDLTPFPAEQNTLVIGDAAFRLVPLPGHSSGHTGIITPDEVFCVGDAMLSDFTIAHAKAPYELDLRQTLQSQETVRRIRCPYYALAHREIVPEAEIDGLADRNREFLRSLAEDAASRVRDGMTEEDLVDAVAAAREIHHDYKHIYFDIYIAIREELQYAFDAGRIRAEGTGMKRRLYRNVRQ